MTTLSAVEASTTPGRARTPRPSSRPEIERGGYLALGSPDPARAAAFAAEHMGLCLVHVDGAGRHYLAAQGLDPYSLVYVPGERGIDHISYVVDGDSARNDAEQRLHAAGVESELIDPNPMWRSAAALRVVSPAGHAIHLTPGVQVEAPMAATVKPTGDGPAPISFDHVAPRSVDVEAEISWIAGVLGLKESARINAPDVGPVIAFFRAHTLFHCLTVVRGPHDGLHHYQFSLKNAPAVHAAFETMRDGGVVDVVWGPLRHGPGHNVAFYIRDADGHFVEYSAEEEIILDDEGYIAQEWSAEDPKFGDEWGSAPPAVFFE